MKPLGKAYKDAEANMGGDFQKLPAGGYVCRILSAEDVPEKEYLKAIFDIEEGDYKGYYSDEWGKKNTFAHTYYISYKESNFGRFKGNLKAIDESNGTNFADDAEKGLDEKKLEGKLVGLLIGYEEYENDRGEVRESAKARTACSVDRIRRGDFKVPKLRKLDGKGAPAAVPDGFSELNEDDFPF